MTFTKIQNVGEKQKRVIWIDILKCICIYFVMLSHLGDNHIATGLRKFYGPFFLTGFLFASGYVYKNRNSFRVHLVKKTKELLIPWFLFSVANILLSQIITFNPDKHNGLIVDLAKNFLQVRGYSDGMWFVNALFVAYIPFYFFIKSYEKEKTNKNAKPKYLILCILFFLINKVYSYLMPKDFFPWGLNGLPWHIEYIPYAMCFMFFGYYFRENYGHKISEWSKGVNKYLALLVYIFTVYIFKILNIDLVWYMKILHSFLESWLGLIVVILFSNSIKHNKFFVFVGQNTLTYFGTHVKIIALLEKALRVFLPNIYLLLYSNELCSTIYSLVFGLAISVVLIIPAKIINKYLPFMAGKSYTKQ